MAVPQSFSTTELGQHDLGNISSSVFSDASIEGSRASVRTELVRRKWSEWLQRELTSDVFYSWSTQLLAPLDQSNLNVPSPNDSVSNWLIVAIAGGAPTSELDASPLDAAVRNFAVHVFPEREGTDNFQSVLGYVSQELEDALRDLQESVNEAREDEFPLPSQTALSNAEALLKQMYEISARRFEVYPTPDGEIAIDVPGGFGRSVIVLCASDGSVLCMVNLDGHHRRARYSTADTLPDGFLRDALADLDKP